MRIIFFILSALFAFNANAQIVDKELKHSGSLTIPESEIPVETRIRICCTSTVDSSKYPLYIVNGKRKAFEEIRRLDVTKIQSIFVVSQKEAKKIYGRKGKYGVILITSKEA